MKEKHRKAIQTVKDVMFNEPHIQFPDLNHPFIIATDASTDGMGAVLMQDIDGQIRICEYYSKIWNEQQRKWSSTQLEFLSVVKALEKWKAIILPHHNIVLCDNKNVEAVMKMKSNLPAKLHRMRIRLAEFSVSVVYYPGTKNRVADYLSRDTVRQQIKELQQKNSQGVYTIGQFQIPCKYCTTLMIKGLMHAFYPNMDCYCDNCNKLIRNSDNRIIFHCPNEMHTAEKAYDLCLRCGMKELQTIDPLNQSIQDTTNKIINPSQEIRDIVAETKAEQKNLSAPNRRENQALQDDSLRLDLPDLTEEKYPNETPDIKFTKSLRRKKLKQRLLE